MSVEEQIQQSDVGVICTLFEVDCTAIFGTILRFTPAPLIADPSLPVPQPIVWRGDTYEVRACEAEGFKWDGQGPLPRPKLTVGNTDSAMAALCIAYNDLQGAVVTRHRVPMRYLDGQPDEDPDVEFDPDIFIIDQKTLQNKVVVEFSLGTAIDIEGRLIPGRQVIQGYCPARQRYWNGVSFVYNQGTFACPYTDMRYYNRNGEQVADPALEEFSKRIDTCCKVRFPTGPLPFGGFPGVARVGR